MPRNSNQPAAAADGRTAKTLRVLLCIAGQGHAPGTGGPAQTGLSRQELAERAGVTPRNLDAIIRMLRSLGFDIQHSDSSGYYLDDPYGLKLPRVKTPADYQKLLSLRRFISQTPGPIEQPEWLDVLDQLLADSESARRMTMGRGFRDARVDEAGIMYRLDEPMIFYLNVHRADPDPLTRAHLRRLTDAISRRLAVRMTYINRAGIRDRIVVEPYFIFQREGTIYLAGVQVEKQSAALTAGIFKPFVISKARCLSLDILPDRTFSRNPDYEPERCLSATGIRSGGQDDSVTADIDIIGKFAYNACEMIHGESSTARWTTDGTQTPRLHLEATFGSRYDLVRYVLAFGDTAELNQPEDVRAIIRENIIGMARRYGLKPEDFQPDAG